MDSPLSTEFHRQIDGRIALSNWYHDTEVWLPHKFFVIVWPSWWHQLREVGSGGNWAWVLQHVDTKAGTVITDQNQRVSHVKSSLQDFHHSSPQKMTPKYEALCQAHIKTFDDRRCHNYNEWTSLDQTLRRTRKQIFSFNILASVTIMGRLFGPSSGCSFINAQVCVPARRSLRLP